VPGLGEHTAEVLSEIGLGPDELQTLFKSQVVFDPENPMAHGAAHGRREKYAENMAGAIEKWQA
jgi:hypothetical protein